MIKSKGRENKLKVGILTIASTWTSVLGKCGGQGRGQGLSTDLKGERIVHGFSKESAN
jgi:hypothetical protein